MRMGRTLPTTSPYSYFLTGLKDTLTFDDRIMHLGLEYLKETRFTNLLSRLWSFNECSS